MRLFFTESAEGEFIFCALVKSKFIKSSPTLQLELEVQPSNDHKSNLSHIPQNWPANLENCHFLWASKILPTPSSPTYIFSHTYNTTVVSSVTSQWRGRAVG